MTRTRAIEWLFACTVLLAIGLFTGLFGWLWTILFPVLIVAALAIVFLGTPILIEAEILRFYAKRLGFKVPR